MKREDASHQLEPDYLSVQSKFDLDTPCLVLDMDFLEENLRKMQDNLTTPHR